MMTSSKPYLLRALYEWLLDNGMSPFVLVNTSVENVMIPPGIASDNQVVLNLSPSAIQGLHMDNEHIRFSARFSGVSQEIYLPMASVLAIYARENGQGMMFPDEPDDAEIPEETASNDKGGAAPAPLKATHLKLIK